MKKIIYDIWNILRVDLRVIERIRDDRSGLWIAIRLFLVVTLFMSVGGLISDLSSEPVGVISRLESLADRLDQLAAKLPPFLADNVQRLESTLNNSAESLKQYQPPLGKDVSYFLRAFGSWISRPFALLGGWMSAALAVFIMAKVLKGKGDLREHLSVFLLGIAPFVLLVISGFSFANTIIGIVGNLAKVLVVIWSFIILIAAIKIAHGFTSGKAFLTLIVTILVFLVIFPLISALLLSLLVVLIL